VNEFGAGKYDQLYRDAQDLLWGESVSRFVESNVGDSALACVDLGCGDGKNLTFLAARFPDAECVGVDISSEALGAAWRRVTRSSGVGAKRIKLLQGDVGALPLDGLFDLVVACGVAHCLEPEAFDRMASWISSHLAIGGRLLFTSITDGVDLVPWHRTGELYLRSVGWYRRALGQKLLETRWSSSIDEDRHPRVGDHHHEILRAVYLKTA
jgi:SAM-dependent methyltransferase